VAAALQAGVRRLVAQSIAWAYAPGPTPHAEEDPLDVAADGMRAVTVGGIVALERHVIETPPIEGLVLRYGRLYGPGTGADAPDASLALHVDAAAWAACLAVDKGSPGRFNIAETDTIISTTRARHELGWSPDFRLGR
jgi:hypothetical protein